MSRTSSPNLTLRSSKVGATRQKVSQIMPELLAAGRSGGHTIDRYLQTSTIDTFGNDLNTVLAAFHGMDRNGLL
jgi:hypothetical protein